MIIIIITKSANNAIAHIGPFASTELAHDFATAQYGRDQEWWIANVSAPTDRHHTYTLFRGLND